MKKLKEDIIEAVQDATDTVNGTVSIPILDHFLDGILNEQCNIADISVSLLEFIEELKYMMGLYGAGRYAQAEQTRDELSKKLDDVMRLGNKC